jgi:hypothetical protein
MAKVSNFDVLKRMGELNKNIQACNTITDMDYSQKLGGTKVTVGVPGNVVFDIQDGKLNAVLLLYDMREFKELKAAMEREANDGA